MIDYHSFPDAETERYEESEQKASELIKDATHSDITSFHWSHKPKMADELETGDWIIQIIEHEDKNIDVYPPAQLLWIDHYVRDVVSGKERHIFHLEIPKRGQTMKWQVFRKATTSALGTLLDNPRTRPIRDSRQADGLLSLWTLGGRIARR